MNVWVKKSIELASSPGYLDNLLAVYPMEQGELREIPLEIQALIKKHLAEENKELLISILLSLELFPIKDSYVAYLRRNVDSIKKNPQTISRIFDRLKTLGFEGIISTSGQAKELNRQIGPMFRTWLPTIGYPQLPESQFLNTEKTAFLDGSDALLKDFANKHLGTSLYKGLDLVAKKGNTFIIGEAKFLTDFGGHQNAQFNDAMNLVEEKNTVKVIRIAILDGIAWIQSNNQIHRRIKESNKVVLSALLLKDFIESLK